MTTTRHVDYWLDKPEEYWCHRTLTGWAIEEAVRIRSELFPEDDLFAVRDVGGWQIVLGVLGRALKVHGSPTVEQAIAAHDAYLRQWGITTPARLRKQLQEEIAVYGVSPRYVLDPPIDEAEHE